MTIIPSTFCMDLLHLSGVLSIVLILSAALPSPIYQYFVVSTSIILILSLTFFLYPLWGSKEKESIKTPAGRIIHVRTAESGNIRTIDMFVLRFIIIPNWTSDTNHIQAQIAHEAAHVDRGDTRLFFIIIPTLIYCCMVISIISIYFLFYNSGPTALIEFVDEEGSLSEHAPIITAAFFSSLLTLSVMNLALSLLSARERELLTDQLTYQRLGKNYHMFLNDYARIESFENSSVSLRAWNSITHPSFKVRASALSGTYGYLSTATVWSGMLSAVGTITFFFSAFILTIIFVIKFRVFLQEFYNIFHNADTAQIIVFPLVLLVGFSGFLYFIGYQSILIFSACQRRNYSALLSFYSGAFICFFIVGIFSGLAADNLSWGLVLMFSFVFVTYVGPQLLNVVFWTVFVSVSSKLPRNIFIHIIVGVILLITSIISGLGESIQSAFHSVISHHSFPISN